MTSPIKQDADKEDYGSANITDLYVLTRDRIIAASNAEKIYKDMEDFGFDTKPLYKTKQTDCHGEEATNFKLEMQGAVEGVMTIT